MEEVRGRISAGQILNCGEAELNSVRDTLSDSSELEKSLRQLRGNGTKCLKNPWLNHRVKAQTRFFFPAVTEFRDGAVFHN